MHVLKAMNTMEPPIRELTPKEVNTPFSFLQKYEKIWSGKDSLKNSLIYVLNQLENCAEKTESLQELKEDRKTENIKLHS